jgi:hypothetical protein
MDIQAIAGGLEGYAQYPVADYRNGARLKVKDGPEIMMAFNSHHYCLLTGEHPVDIRKVDCDSNVGFVTLAGKPPR